MKIYTKTGDKGETSLFGGKRISKADPIVDAYGEVDELNSWVGLLIAEKNSSRNWAVVFLNFASSKGQLA